MNDLSVVKVAMNSIASEVLEQWAKLYCEVWKDAPWNEDFWKPEEVIKDFQKEMRNPDAAAFLSICDSSVVGFTHGYSVNRQELRSIAGNSLLDQVFGDENRIFYIDELGVASAYRGKRISLALSEALLRSAFASGVKIVILRTDAKANVARHVYVRLGFVELDVHDTSHIDRTYWVLRNRLDSFKSLFQFDPAKALFVGVEQECFLLDESGVMAPIASHVLGGLPKREDTSLLPKYGYELSACQLEYKVGPCQIGMLYKRLTRLEDELTMYEKRLGFRRLHSEVGPEDMPLDVYPDPSGRYQEIVKTMPRHILLAACRVIGTHVHVGMPDPETALKVYNHVIEKCDQLCSKGNGSFGERLDIYRIVAPDCDPPPYADWSELFHVACMKGFDKDPRKCWTLIRISKHGTIEFRMFGATASVDRVVSWAKLCHDLCAEALV